MVGSFSSSSGDLSMDQTPSLGIANDSKKKKQEKNVSNRDANETDGDKAEYSKEKMVRGLLCEHLQTLTLMSACMHT